MIIFANTGAVWTFRDVEEYSNRVAHLFISQGFYRGDVVAIYMTNKPEFIAIQLGMAKIGIVCALINSNLKQEGLYHCVNVANCCGIVYDHELESNILNVFDKFRLVSYG
jgi:solute carrier family 27 fatty acid transporter 1/4